MDRTEYELMAHSADLIYNRETKNTSSLPFPNTSTIIRDNIERKKTELGNMIRMCSNETN
jgi:hypothetical protein